MNPFKDFDTFIEAETNEENRKILIFIKMRLTAVIKENDKLRFLLAKSKADCVYCGKPAEDFSKCTYGFPGCPRADDLMCGDDVFSE